MKKILFFGAPVFQIPVIEKAKQMGLYVGVVDIDPNAAAIPYADEYFCCSLKDNEQLYQIAKDFHPDGVLSGACDTSVVSVSYVCEKLGLPGHSSEVAESSTDKLKMLQAFENRGVPHPRYQLVRHSEMHNINVQVPFPAISKPENGSGSRGISFISNEEDLPLALDRSFEASNGGDVLLEEYLKGSEVSVEVAVVNGKPHILQITDKITSGAPYFFEIGHSQPSVLPSDVILKIKEVASKAVTAVGIINSPAHVEIKITEEGPKMIELGARLGGGCISTYLLDTSVEGISLAEMAIRMALGEEIDVPAYRDSGNVAAVRFLLPKNGVLTSVEGLESAAKVDGVVKIHFYGKLGEHYISTTENADRIGFVVASGKTQREAFSLCDYALKLVTVNYN